MHLTEIECGGRDKHRAQIDHLASMNLKPVPGLIAIYLAGGIAFAEKPTFHPPMPPLDFPNKETAIPTAGF